MNKVYRNSTELMNLHGFPVYMTDMVDACLEARLNLFLQGDTGSGKTQLAKDVMGDFGYGVGDGNFARELEEKYGSRLDAKGQSVIDATKRFSSDKSLFILGRNDMIIRDLFQQINLGKLNQKPTYNLEPLINPESGEVEWYYPRVSEEGVFIYRKLAREQAKMVRKGLENLAGTTENIMELTKKINTHLVVVDELPNCVPAVRAQLFNLFDGYVEVGGKAYPIGGDYSVGIATGNIGQQFTESSNELGRALKDRMHVIIDTDYFFPKPSDTFHILAENTNPRVDFTSKSEDNSNEIIQRYKELASEPIPFEKLILANYLLHALDYCSKGSKRKMKDDWPTQLENHEQNHEQGSDVGLVLPVSPRAAKSIIKLSQALDNIVKRKGAEQETIESGYFDSMMQAYKFVSAYSGILNEGAVRAKYEGDNYKALDAIITTTNTEFEGQAENLACGLEMVQNGKVDAKILDFFTGRWEFMRDTLEGFVNESRGE